MKYGEYVVIHLRMMHERNCCTVLVDSWYANVLPDIHCGRVMFTTVYFIHLGGDAIDRTVQM